MKRGQTEKEKEETTFTEDTTSAEFNGCKYVGLFFSAGWCPASKTMLKSLKNFYTDANLQQRTLEVVLVSSDRSADDWQQWHGTMSWLSLDWSDKKNDEMRKKFEVRGIPRLVILDAKTGFPITEKGRKDLKDDVKGVYESWDKLYELKKVWAVENAKTEAISIEERLEREEKEREKKKRDEERAAAA